MAGIYNIGRPARAFKYDTEMIMLVEACLCFLALDNSLAPSYSISIMYLAMNHKCLRPAHSSQYL